MSNGSGLQRPAGDLYDNGGWDGVSGYSSILGGGQSLDRSLLDDFTVPAGGWDIGGADTLFIWDSGDIGIGTDMTVEFYADLGNCTPDTTPIAVAANRVYSEEDAGFQAFGREALNVSVTFDTIHLDAGHYWIDLALVSDVDLGFILTAAQSDCECWVDYADFGGRSTGSDFFGLLPSDIVFGLSGGAQPPCLSMTVSPLIAGEFATWDISGATPGSLVVVVNGFMEGSTQFVDEMGFCATFGIADVTTNRVVGHAVADGSGNASIVRHILKNLSGLTALTQAAEQGTCPDECVSNLDTQVVG